MQLIKFVDKKSLTQVSTEIKGLVEKAKSKNLTLSEMQGATFCISNLGMFGIESFTSIINPPSSCILAVGAIKNVPVCDEDGNIKAGNIMKVTMSCDHRVVDGSIGAQFLAHLKKVIEEPITLLL